MDINTLDEDHILKPNENHRLTYESSTFYKGLFSLIFSLIPGAIIGLILVKIALDHAKLAHLEYERKPNYFSADSLKKVKSGKTMAYIALVIFIIEILIIISFI